MHLYICTNYSYDIHAGQTWLIDEFENSLDPSSSQKMSKLQSRSNSQIWEVKHWITAVAEDTWTWSNLQPEPPESTILSVIVWDIAYPRVFSDSFSAFLVVTHKIVFHSTDSLKLVTNNLNISRPQIYAKSPETRLHCTKDFLNEPPPWIRDTDFDLLPWQHEVRMHWTQDGGSECVFSGRENEASGRESWTVFSFKQAFCEWIHAYSCLTTSIWKFVYIFCFSALTCSQQLLISFDRWKQPEKQYLRYGLRVGDGLSTVENAVCAIIFLFQFLDLLCCTRDLLHCVHLLL